MAKNKNKETQKTNTKEYKEMANKMLKEETVKRIKNLLLQNDITTAKELKAHAGFSSLHNNFMNKIEKQYADNIIEWCISDLSFADMKKEMAKLLENDEVKLDDSDVDETKDDSMLLVSQQKVVDAAGPVEVTIGDESETIESELTSIFSDVIKNFTDDEVIKKKVAELLSEMRKANRESERRDNAMEAENEKKTKEIDMEKLTKAVKKAVEDVANEIIKSAVENEQKKPKFSEVVLDAIRECREAFGIEGNEEPEVYEKPKRGPRVPQTPFAVWASHK